MTSEPCQWPGAKNTADAGSTMTRTQQHPLHGTHCGPLTHSAACCYSPTAEAQESTARASTC